MRLKFFMSSLVAVGLLVAAGCGGPDRPELASVTGTVKLDGQPLEGATVTFYPQEQTEGARPASGRTDATGKFVLTSFDTGDGAVLGEHVVTIVKLEEMEGSLEEMDPDDPGAAYDAAMQTASDLGNERMTASQLPNEYVNEATSPERRTVSAGQNEFNFDIQSSN